MEWLAINHNGMIFTYIDIVWDFVVLITDITFQASELDVSFI